MNKVIMTGNIVRDPECRTTQNGTPVCSFTIAVRRDYKDTSGTYPTDFIDCVAWRQTADFICKYFAKGSGILVEGQNQKRKYEDKEGKTRWIQETKVDKAEFFGKAADKEPKDAEEIFGDELAEFKPLDDSDLPF